VLPWSFGIILDGVFYYDWFLALCGSIYITSQFKQNPADSGEPAVNVVDVNPLTVDELHPSDYTQ